MNSNEIKIMIFDIQVKLERLQNEKGQLLDLLSQVIAKEESEKGKNETAKKQKK